MHNINNTNIEWIDVLNHENNDTETFIKWREKDNKNITPTSIEYKSWITNKYYIIMIVIIVFSLIFTVQVSIRYIYNSWILEQIVVMIICGLFLMISYQLYIKMSQNLDDDEIYLKQEMKLQLIVSSICYFLHLLIFLFVFIIVNVNIDYEWSRLYLFTFTVWTLTMCCIETAFVHQKLEAHYFNIGAKLNESSEDNFDDAYSITHSIIDIGYRRLSLDEKLSLSTAEGDEQELISSAEQNMMKCIQKQSGFELFMEYLNKEQCLQVALLIVDSTFYLNQWAKTRYNKYEIYPMINKCIYIMINIEYIISKDLILLISEYYAKLYHDKPVFELDMFPFLEQPHFKTQKENWNYIMNKFIYNGSSNYIIPHMNMKEILSAEIHQNKQECWEVIHNLRKDQINLATSLWIKFKESREYQEYYKDNNENTCSVISDIL